MKQTRVWPRIIVHGDDYPHVPLWAESKCEAVSYTVSKNGKVALRMKLSCSGYVPRFVVTRGLGPFDPDAMRLAIHNSCMGVLKRTTLVRTKIPKPFTKPEIKEKLAAHKRYIELIRHEEIEDAIDRRRYEIFLKPRKKVKP